MKVVCWVVLSCILMMPVVVLGQLNTEQQETLETRLRLRKLSWESHKAAQKADQERRQAAAHKHKKARYEYEFAKKQERRNFFRVNAEFPLADYREFIRRRDNRLARTHQQRERFQKMRKAAERILDANQYKIDKREVYNL